MRTLPIGESSLLSTLESSTGEIAAGSEGNNEMNGPEIRNAASPVADVSSLQREPEDHPVGLEVRGGVEQRFLDYYGLNEQPFGVTPDLRFLYLGTKHRQALDALNFGTELNRGFLTLIAQPGMGKTSLLFHYLEGLRDKARTVFLFQTDGDSTELMRYLLADLGLDGKGMDLPEMRAVLGQVLMGEMQAGRRFVLVVDEAQNLDEKVLESIRLLSNFETPWMKLMHIVLAGQPQLAERLAQPSLAQFRQRVSFAIRIEPFSGDEVNLYINHRLWTAGYKGVELFSPGARALISKHSEGVPRKINNICFCAMTYAWALKRKSVDRDTMAEVIADLDPGPETEAPAAPKLREESDPPKVLQVHQPVPLTLNSPPSRRWFGKLALIILAGIALGWVSIQPDIEKWIGSSVNAISSALKSHLIPAATDVHAEPAVSATPDATNGMKAEDSTGVSAPRQNGVATTPSVAGSN